MKNFLSYQAELDFFLNTLDYSKIDYHHAVADKMTAGDVDLGLRDEIGLSNSFLHLRRFFEKNLSPKSIVFITDEFFCHYILLFLPETSPEEALIIGPYLLSSDANKIADYMNKDKIAPNWYSTLQNYYLSLSCLPNENVLDALLFSFSDCIWGKDSYTIEHYTNSIPESVLALAKPPESLYSMKSLTDFELIERFYSMEDALIHAISHGHVARAKNLLSSLPLLTFKNQGEPTQNLKVFSISMNTIFRKAAQQGGVHPIYVDQLSSTMLEHIDKLTRSDNVLDFWNEMIQKYCTLVNNHSTHNYSLPIQKVIIQINLDLSADLSLKALAEYLNVNASYLSNLFRKETGVTLTTYVNQKRMEYAAWMLSSTAFPISTIAQYCGILDDNYFSKLFKKQYNITPTQFRDSVGKHDLSKTKLQKA